MAVATIVDRSDGKRHESAKIACTAVVYSNVVSKLKNEYNPRTLEDIWRIAEWFSASELVWLAAIGVAKSVQKQCKMVAGIDKM